MPRAGPEPRTDIDEEALETPTATFEAFFGAEHRGLFGALYLITGNRQEAEEIMQEAFLRLWERWDRVAEVEDRAGYLYRTALNLFRMRRRRAAVAARRLVRRIAPSDAFDAVDQRDAIDRALATLSPRRRAALVLTDLLGYSSDDAADMLGVRAVTVRVLASQARDGIRRWMVRPDD